MFHRIKRLFVVSFRNSGEGGSMVFDSNLFRYAPPQPPTADAELASPYTGWSDAELNELFQERAAIAEYSGKLSRQEAEEESLEWLKIEIGESRFKVWCSNPITLQSQKVVASPARLTTETTN